MEGGDLSNLSTPRMWVLEDVVLSREPVLAVNPPKAHWWARKAPVAHQEAVVVQLGAVNILWRYGQRMAVSGLRMELVHIGDDDQGSAILDLLDRSSSSPFNDVVSFPTMVAMVDSLAFRPDVINVVAPDDLYLRFGGRGIALRDLG